MLTKEHFRTTWYYRLLQVMFWGSYSFFAIALILLGIFESDVEIAGFFWAGVLGLVYWIGKRALYYVLFAEPLISLKK